MARQRFFWLYFSMVLNLEILLLFKIIPYKIYQLSFFIYIPFFIYVYSLESKKKFLFIFLLLISFIIGTYLFIAQSNIQIQLGILMSFIYITIAIFWFFDQLKTTHKIPIIKKQLFWISTAILLIGIISIFRLIPMYYFNNTDKNFLLLTNYIYQYSIIISYFIFFKGLTCKQ